MTIHSTQKLRTHITSILTMLCMNSLPAEAMYWFDVAETFGFFNAQKNCENNFEENKKNKLIGIGHSQYSTIGAVLGGEVELKVETQKLKKAGAIFSSQAGVFAARPALESARPAPESVRKVTEGVPDVLASNHTGMAGPVLHGPRSLARGRSRASRRVTRRVSKPKPPQTCSQAYPFLDTQAKERFNGILADLCEAEAKFIPPETNTPREACQGSWSRVQKQRCMRTEITFSGMLPKEQCDKVKGQLSDVVNPTVDSNTLLVASLVILGGVMVGCAIFFALRRHKQNVRQRQEQWADSADGQLARTKWERTHGENYGYHR